MSHQVTIQPSGHHFSMEEDESVLSAALREGFNLPYGCRNGACGSCKGRLLEGHVTHSGSATGLTDADREAGKILFCVAHPTSDISIECREIGAARDIQIRTLPCRVHRLERLADDVMRIFLKLPSNERLQFLPGQYIDILLKDGQRRSFSIANAPHDDALVELHVREVPQGMFTSHVFHGMKEKDILRIEGPLGDFWLREDSDRPLLFIAGGTGFAPIQAMISHALHHRQTRPMTLYWGARARKDLYLADTPARWAAEHEHLRWTPVLSQPADADQWEGRRGLVTDAVAQDHPDLSGFDVYVCGAPAMVDAARRMCQQRNLPDDAFFADAFSFQGATA
ncbi:MAG: CDP-6-deoxy-delta-3,4-glucoseen reductase [Betaproteobacteria bacterium]|nr:CDP-6-deoxy-delta-3,4-glucoseen reductase [Betaproteobacteria bacterium]